MATLPNGDLVISASQLDTFLDCPRKWWFERVLRLPQVQKGYFTFGTVLHGCIERWMAADAQGRVPDTLPIAHCIKTRAVVVADGPLFMQYPGDPVSVFPAGWETIEERGSSVSVTPNEARLIRALFEEAVERGILVRDGRISVERRIDLPVIDGVALTGYLDFFLPAGVAGPVPEVHDHKSFGESSVRFLKQPGPTDDAGNELPIDEPYKKEDGTSPNSIGHNQQVLTYGAATSIIDGYEGPVRLRHNQFPKFKDPRGVRKVTALVSSKRLREHWAFVQETARRMKLVHKIKKWVDTPGPESTDTCSKYGGCPFQKICGKSETPDSYRGRVEAQTKQRADVARPNLKLEPKRKKSGGTMGLEIFKRAKEQAAARAAQMPAPAAEAKPAAQAAAPAVKPAVNTGPVAATPSVVGGAPWAKPNCPACKGLGMNKSGRPCAICDKTAAKDGRPTSEMYAVEITDAGAVAVAREDKHEVLAELGAEFEWAQADAKVTAAPSLQHAAASAPVPTAKLQPVPEVEPPTTQTVGDPSATAVVTAVKPAKAKGPKPVDEPTPTEEAQQAIDAAKAPKDAKGQAGRPRIGLTLMLGVAQLKGPGRPCVIAQDLMNKIGAELATEMGAESYWDLDQYKRKDRIRRQGELIAADLGRSIVMFPGGTMDFDLIALFNALEPHAEVVLEGLK